MIGTLGSVGEGQGLGTVIIFQLGKFFRHLTERLIPGQLLPLSSAFFAHSFQGIIEALRMMDMIRQVHKELGLAIFLIEHRMKFVMELCEIIQTLDFGEVIAEGTP